MQTPVVLSDQAIQQLAQAISSVTITSSSLDWPACVQAIGSVAAILAAFFIANWEARRSTRDKTQSEAELVETIAHFWQEALDEVAYLAQNSGDIVDNVADISFVLRVLRSDLSDLRSRVAPKINKLAELPLTAWPNIGMGLDFYTFQANLVATVQTLEHVIAAPASDADDRQLMREYTTKISETASDAKRNLAAYQLNVAEFRQATQDLGGETRMSRQERIAKDEAQRKAELKAEADALLRENQRQEIIDSFPPPKKRTSKETGRLESILALQGLEPLIPVSDEERAAQEQAESDFVAEEERLDRVARDNYLSGRSRAGQQTKSAP